MKKGVTKITSLEKMYYRYPSFKKPRLNSSSSLYEDSSNNKLGHILEFTHLLRTFSKACYIQYLIPNVIPAYAGMTENEVTVGVEPTNGGFANRSLRPLGNVTKLTTIVKLYQIYFLITRKALNGLLMFLIW